MHGRSAIGGKDRNSSSLGLGIDADRSGPTVDYRGATAGGKTGAGDDKRG